MRKCCVPGFWPKPEPCTTMTCFWRINSFTKIAAGAQLPSHFDEMVLWALESGLDGVLLGVVGAEPSAQQAVNAFGIGLYHSGVAGDDAPSDAPSGDKVVLRHAAESDAGNIGRDGGEGNVRGAVKN